MNNKKNFLVEAFKHAWLLGILFFAFVPLFLMIVISFKSNEQFQANPWFFDPISEWHWENWSNAWNLVFSYISNSIFVAVIGVTSTIIMVVMASYVLARYNFPAKGIIYYAILGTMFLPGTAATLVTVFSLLDSLNLINTLWAIVVMESAAGQVMGIFLLKNYIEDIPKELFESVQIDGGGHFAQIKNVVLPMSGSIIGIVLIMDFLNAWNSTILPLVVLRDPEFYTIPVGLLYLEGEYVKQWGEMMAGFAIGAGPLIVLFIFTMRLFVRGLSAGAVKG